MKTNKMQCAGCKRRFFSRLRRFVYARSRRSAYMRVGRTAVCPRCYERTRSAGEHGWPLSRPPYCAYSSRSLAEASPIETRDVGVTCAGCKRGFVYRLRHEVYTHAGTARVCEGCDYMTHTAGEHGWRFTGEPYKLYASRAFADASMIRSTKDA